MSASPEDCVQVRRGGAHALSATQRDLRFFLPPPRPILLIRLILRHILHSSRIPIPPSRHLSPPPIKLLFAFLPQPNLPNPLFELRQIVRPPGRLLNIGPKVQHTVVCLILIEVPPGNRQ